MENGEIGDDQITATKWHADSSAAKYSRFNTQEGAGAWCHPTVDKGDHTQYLQVLNNGLIRNETESEQLNILKD